ncbi:uncharacterized protein LOC113352733 [Papaver somniferum]|uniref:uncharacterized protein LOC113352733 n=1 Tax=Papaver somniferum TaxID=3469 RepID=UPI000E6FC10D|nr:uncharacterized protein LOC113352733 [Papaver somniferum]
MSSVDFWHAYFRFCLGEASPTLEDVVALTGLPIHSSHSFEEADHIGAMTSSDSEVYKVLSEVRKSIARKVSADAAAGLVKEDKRASLLGWMNYWALRVTETMSKKELPSVVKSYDPPTHGHSDYAELVAFLVYWLIHDFFECSPKDTIRDDILRMATKMSGGITYPLAPMFLGLVYRHLDTLISDVEITNSQQHIIESYVPTSFIHFGRDFLFVGPISMT